SRILYLKRKCYATLVSYLFCDRNHCGNIWLRWYRRRCRLHCESIVLYFPCVVCDHHTVWCELVQEVTSCLIWPRAVQCLYDRNIEWRAAVPCPAPFPHLIASR